MGIGEKGPLDIMHSVKTQISRYIGNVTAAGNIAEKYKYIYCSSDECQKVEILIRSGAETGLDLHFFQEALFALC